MSKQPVTLDDIHTLLLSFIERQESFNSRQESFNSRQESFNSRQESFNSRQESFNSRIEAKIDRIQEEETANHNLSHRMIFQSYDYINDIKQEMVGGKESWLKGKK